MTLVLADYGLGEALLTVLAIFFMVIWIWILITVIIDLFRDHELSGWWKAVWLFFLIFVPVITVLIYLIARGNGMRERAIAEQRELQQATDAYIRETAGTSPADQIAKLNELRQSGAISEEEYQALKAKAIG
jgi:hypothetical protein